MRKQRLHSPGTALFLKLAEPVAAAIEKIFFAQTATAGRQDKFRLKARPAAA